MEAGYDINFEDIIRYEIFEQALGMEVSYDIDFEDIIRYEIYERAFREITILPFSYLV